MRRSGDRSIVIADELVEALCDFQERFQGYPAVPGYRDAELSIEKSTPPIAPSGRVGRTRQTGQSVCLAVGPNGCRSYSSSKR